MSTPQLHIPLVGTIVERHVKVLDQTKTLFKHTIEIAPEGRQRNPRQLYLQTYSLTFDAQLTEAMQSKQPVKVVLELIGKPDIPNRLIGFNLLTPLSVEVINTETQNQ